MNPISNNFEHQSRRYRENAKCQCSFFLVLNDLFVSPIGPQTSRFTLRMPQSLTSPIIATSRPLSPGILQKLLTLIITPALSLINIAFFLTNNAFHTYHLYCSYFVFILPHSFFSSYFYPLKTTGRLSKAYIYF